jgi:hypothetical protein
MTRANYAFVTLLLVAAALVVFHLGAYVLDAKVALVLFEACSIASLFALVMAIRAED